MRRRRRYGTNVNGLHFGGDLAAERAIAELNERAQKPTESELWAEIRSLAASVLPRTRPQPRRRYGFEGIAFVPPRLIASASLPRELRVERVGRTVRFSRDAALVAGGRLQSDTERKAVAAALAILEA